MSNKIRYQQILFSGDSGNSPFLAGTDGGVLLPDIVIEAGSTSRLSFNPTTRELSLSSLGVVKVTVDSVEPDMATFAANQYPTGTEFQEGDTVILSAATGGPQTWIHNGGTSGTAADFTVIEAPNLTDAYIRALFSSANAAINYNNLTGVFTFTLDPSANNLATITPSGLFVDDTRIDNLETLSGVAGATDLGTFTGTTVPDNTDIKTALQSLETALEATTSGQSNHEEGQATGAVTTTFTVPTLSSGWSTPSGYKVVVYKNGQRLAHDAGLAANTYRVNSATQFEIDSRLASDVIVWEIEKA